MKELLKLNKPALVVGLYAAILHALWAVFVALGFGQSYLDWIFPLHFIDNIYTVMAFNWGSAIMLVVAAFVAGYLATLLFVCLWKKIKIK